MPWGLPRRWLIAKTFLLIVLASSAVAAESSTRQQKITNPKQYDAQVIPSQNYQDLHPTQEVTFLPVVYVSILNAVVNVVRPDAAIIWQARIPRTMWELCIAFIASNASASNPPICLLLCLMTLPTALVDIFVWAPSFAMFAKFESCTGGGILSRQPRVCTSDYVKGVGRLFVSVQSVLTGVLYLFAAVASWTAFAESRDTSIARKNANAMADTMGRVK